MLSRGVDTEEASFFLFEQALCEGQLSLLHLLPQSSFCLSPNLEARTSRTKILRVENSFLFTALFDLYLWPAYTSPDLKSCIHLLLCSIEWIDLCVTKTYLQSCVYRSLQVVADYLKDTLTHVHLALPSGTSCWGTLKSDSIWTAWTICSTLRRSLWAACIRTSRSIWIPSSPP